MVKRKIEPPEEARIASDSVGRSLPDTRVMRFVRFIGELLWTVLVAWIVVEAFLLGPLKDGVSENRKMITELRKAQMENAAIIRRIEALNVDPREK